MKRYIFTAAGMIFGGIAQIFGGWSASMTTLLILMGADYITGLLVAGVFKKSPKTGGGGLESRAGFKGLCRKAVVLLFVLIAARLDLAIGTNYLKDTVCIGFMLNELLSVMENAGLMGVPLPAALTKAIEILKGKAEVSEYTDNKENDKEDKGND